jgi:hypothetical protein
VKVLKRSNSLKMATSYLAVHSQIKLECKRSGGTRLALNSQMVIHIGIEEGKRIVTHGQTFLMRVNHINF